MNKRRTLFLLILIWSLTSCTSRRDDIPLFNKNSSLSSLDEGLRILNKDFDLLLVHKSYNEPESRMEYRVFASKGDHWNKITYYSDSKNSFQKSVESNLTEDRAKIILLRLQQAHLFDIETMDTLLKRHIELCGAPSDPSHFLTFELILISGTQVRKLRFENPDGRYEMCPAIKNWENASKLNHIFIEEWGVDKF